MTMVVEFYEINLMKLQYQNLSDHTQTWNILLNLNQSNEDETLAMGLKDHKYY